MIIVMNRIPVAAGREGEFEESFTERERAINLMPGFIDMQVLRPTEGRTYIVLTRWQSQEAFQNWIQSDAFVASHKQQPSGLAETRPTLEIYEVFSD